jgi:8-oxo-dGTP diphosphatase
VSAPRPLIGVGGVVVADGRVLLARRGKEPLRGRWTIPGGTVELGETLEAALVREMAEETALRVEPVEVLTVFDRIRRVEGTVASHYVIVDFLCRWRAGEAHAGSDAEEVAWVGTGEFGRYDLPAKTREVVDAAFRRVKEGALARTLREA